MQKIMTLRKFQFQYGSIKRKTDKVRIRRCPSFNSNMVRLKEEVARNQVGHLTFQFQYGSIKRSHLSITLLLISLVSIPIWFD